MNIRRIIRKSLPGFIVAQVRSQRLRSKIKAFQPFVREGNFSGHALKVSIEDPLSAGWYGKDKLYDADLAFMRAYRLKPGARVFDIGAFQSVTAMMLAREVGETGAVVAVEANPHNVAVGLRNKALNDISQLTIIHCAVGEHSGEISFDQNLNGSVFSSASQTNHDTVSAKTIDDLMADTFVPDLIILDIEGYEVRALHSGATAALDAGCDWMIELHQPEKLANFGGSVEDVLCHFETRDYMLYAALEYSDFIPFKRQERFMDSRFFLFATKIA